MCDQNAQRLILRLEDVTMLPVHDQNQLLRYVVIVTVDLTRCKVYHMNSF